MIDLNQIDLKLKNSFKNIKKDMDSFRKQLTQHSERIGLLEQNIDKNKLNKVLENHEDSISSLKQELKDARKEFTSKEKLDQIKDQIKPEKPKKPEKKEKSKEEKPKKGTFDKIIDFFAEED